jgi:hypothetical protein
MTRACPHCGTVLDGGPVIFWCPGCGRDCHGSCAPLVRTPDRVVARYPGTPEPGAGHRVPAGAAGRNAQTTRPAALNPERSAA